MTIDLYSNLNFPIPLRQEADKIQDERIRNFVYIALASADTEFWTDPCCRNEHHHPPEDNSIGGLVRHTIKTACCAGHYAERHHFTQIETDMAIAGAVLHDIKQKGNPWGRYTDLRHGIIASSWLGQFELNNQTVKQIILDSVRYHLGEWVTTFVDGEKINEDNFKEEMNEKMRARNPHSVVESCVQEADFWSSRMNISFLPDRPLSDFS